MVTYVTKPLRCTYTHVTTSARGLCFASSQSGRNYVVLMPATTSSPYRSLPTARRVALIIHALSTRREARVAYVQRLVTRGGGFRAVTLQAWPAERLAREVVRLNAESPHDELDLLHTLYVELEPAVQSTFLDAAGVPHTNGVMAESLEPPYANAEAVARGADAVRAAYGEEGVRYLRTLARYSAAAWPGVTEQASADVD